MYAHRVDLESPAEPAHMQRLTVDGIGALSQHAIVVHHERTAVVLRHNLTETCHNRKGIADVSSPLPLDQGFILHPLADMSIPAPTQSLREAF